MRRRKLREHILDYWVGGDNTEFALHMFHTELSMPHWRKLAFSSRYEGALMRLPKVGIKYAIKVRAFIDIVAFHPSTCRPG